MENIKIINISAVYHEELNCEFIYALSESGDIYVRRMRYKEKWQKIMPINEETLYKELLD